MIPYQFTTCNIIRVCGLSAELFRCIELNLCCLISNNNKKLLEPLMMCDEEHHFEKSLPTTFLTKFRGHIKIMGIRFSNYSFIANVGYTPAIGILVQKQNEL